MYGKVFTDIFDSSLMAEGGWLPTYVFMCMVSLGDKNGHLRQDPRTLYRRIGLAADERVSFGEFMDALEYLEKEDDVSNLPTHEGRRIIPAPQVDEIEGNRGWLIVNYVYYRDKGGSIEARRKSDAERKRRSRERQNNNLESGEGKCHVTVTDGHAESAHTDIDTDTTPLSHAGARELPKWEDHEDPRFNGRKAPPNFVVPEEMIAKMIDETGLSREDIDQATAMFMDHCHEKTAFDWYGRWRNWIRRERRPAPGSNGGGGGRQTYREKLDEDIERLEAEGKL